MALITVIYKDQRLNESFTDQVNNSKLQKKEDVENLSLKDMCA